MWVEVLVSGLGIYLLVGLVAAVVLHLSELRRIDPGIAGGGIFFRLVVTPGLVALWPWMMAKVWRSRRGGAPQGDVDRPLRPSGLRRVHRWGALGIALVVMALALAAILARPAEGDLATPSAEAGRGEP